MYKILSNTVSASSLIGILSLTIISGQALAQDADTFDVSVTTSAAVAIACGQNLSFGAVYVGATNNQAVVTLTSGGAISSNDASVAATGGTVGQCTVSGLQGADTANITLSGAGGTPAAGGLTGVELEDGANTLLATVLVGGGTNASGGQTGVENEVAPIFGSVTIPASHVDFGTYEATLTATVALD